MPAALLAAVAPTLLGLALALAPGLRTASSGWAHRLVLAIATAVVLMLMLPAAVRELGWLALGVFAVALLAPVAVERLAGHRHDHEGESEEAAMDVELGFAGLLLHQGVEGAELGAVFAVGQDPWWVAGAISLHTVPLVAAVVHGCVIRTGLRGGLLRGGALVLASVLGVPLGTVAAGALEGMEPWVSAAVGGLVLHALWHAWRPAH